MKKCKYCQSEIDKKAKICPNCKKKQSHIFRWILIGIIVIGIVSLCFNDDDNFIKEYNQNDIVTYKNVEY